MSSGACLGLEAARKGLAIDRLALWEAPLIVDDSRPPIPAITRTDSPASSPPIAAGTPSSCS
jgi:hypothetical protein